MSTFEVCIKGRPISTYYHQGKTFVEGRKNSEYSLRFYNNSSTRKKIVLSVDGLNIMSGDNKWNRGYVVDPWQTVDIDGYRKDSNNVAAFKFGLIKGSYNQLNESGEKKNIGVIGCLVFNEKYVPPKVIYNNIHHYHDYWPYNYYPKFFYGTNSNIGNTISNQNTLNDDYNVWGGSGLNSVQQNYSGPISASCSEQQNSGGLLRSTGLSSSDQSKLSVPLGKLCDEDTPVEQSIGTEYGRNKEFKTTSVTFEAEANPCETLMIYYDSKEGLIRRGVIQPKVYRNEPEAFPGYNDGVPPPKYVSKRKHYSKNWLNQKI